jgi:hypothetical protein
VCWKFGPFRFEFDKQTAIGDPAEMTNRGQVGFSTGAFTPNDVRELFGKDRVKGNPAMDMHYLGLGVFPIGEVASTPAAPSEPGAPATPAAPAEDAGGKEPAVAPPFPEIEDGHRHHEVRATAMQRRLLRFANARKVQAARAIKRVAVNFFRWQMNQMIARLKDSKGAGEWQVRGPEQVISGMAGDAEAYRGVMRRFFSPALQQEYQATATLLGATPNPDFVPGAPLFEKRLDTLVARSSDIMDYTRDKITDVIQQGLREGRSVNEIARGGEGYLGIEGTFEEMTPWRSQLIARTESARAFDQASTELYAEQGVRLCDVIGCEDNEIVAGQTYGCNSKNIPIAEAASIEFHPNHKGAIVPQPPRRGWGAAEAIALTASDRQGDNNNHALDRVAAKPIPVLIGAT